MAWQSGCTRELLFWHRRAGKDEINLNKHAVSSAQRVGTYWHMLPLANQARKAIWTAVNPVTGRRRLFDAFPGEYIENMNDNEMFMRFKSGSTFQVVGSDNFNALVGSPPIGITFSEWALANPSAWAYLSPILAENGGWASFITTPRGSNHAKSMYDVVSKNVYDPVSNPRGWFTEILPADVTGAISADAIEEQQQVYAGLFGEDMAELLIQQEFYCSFAGAMIGSYWGTEVAKAEIGRFKFLPIDPSVPVNTAWDLGKAVNNPIWCFQVVNGLPRIVDFYMPKSDDLDEWCDWLNEQGYNGIDYVPDDILDPIWGAKHTRWDLLKAKKRKPSLIKRIAVADGIHAGRELIKVATFHRSMMEGDERTERMDHGVDGLKNYRREWDDDRKTFLDNPFKDWAEHIGSSWRYLGLAWREIKKADPPKPKPKVISYEAKADGSVVTNLTANDMIRLNARRGAKR